MIDFFERQSAARRSTVRLAVLYVAAVLLIVPLAYLIALGLAVPIRNVINFFGELYDMHNTFTPRPHPGWWDPTLFARVAAIGLGIMVGGTVYAIRRLRRGGWVVADLLGGVRIEPDTRDPAERRVLNVVEEMAIASGLPVPDVYLLRHQRGINALAAGFTPEDAIIALTRGCLDHLSRDELQGVVAHEFSHILYGDTRLKTWMMGLLYGLEYLGDMASELCTKAAKGDPLSLFAGTVVFIFLGVFTIPFLIVIEIGVLCSLVIRHMLSRQREYLADAAAVQFTRNPDGMAGALRKVGGLTVGSHVFHGAAPYASHFFFSNALSRSIFHVPWLSSHPRLTDRLLRLDPTFNGTFEWIPSSAARIVTARPPLASRLSTESAATVAAPAIADCLGAPHADHLTEAGRLLAAIPVVLADASRTDMGAQAVLAALVMSADAAVREAQLRIIREHADAGVAAAVDQILVAIPTFDLDRRLPLAAMAIRSLHGLASKEISLFRKMLSALIAADRKVDLFEFALQRMIDRRTAPRAGRRAIPRLRRRSLSALIPTCRTLISCLAQWGSRDDNSRNTAYQRGMRSLPEIHAVPGRLPADACTLAAVDKALTQLLAAGLPDRKRVLDACVACVAADNRVSIHEAELLQAIAATLDLPLTPA